MWPVSHFWEAAATSWEIVRTRWGDSSQLWEVVRGSWEAGRGSWETDRESWEIVRESWETDRETWEVVRESWEVAAKSGRSPLRLARHDERRYTVRMVRPQIALEEDLYKAAQDEARRRGISFAELCRRSLAEALQHRDEQPWMRFAGVIESAEPAASQTVDDVVYGRERP